MSTFEMPAAAEQRFLEMNECPDCAANLRHDETHVWCSECGWTPRDALSDRYDKRDQAVS